MLNALSKSRNSSVSGSLRVPLADAMSSLSEIAKDQKPPFANLYGVKHVADNACKACILCFKPTNAVLITADKKDWFYVCTVHLKDKNFAKLVYCDALGKDTEAEWRKLCGTVESLQRELHKIEKKEKDRLVKEKSWLTVIPGWGGKKDEPLKDEKEEEGKEKEKKAGEKSESTHESEKISRSKELVTSELQEVEQRLTAFERENIKYRLENVFYRGRLLQNYKRKKQAEIEQKLSAGTLFPSLDGLSSLKN